MSIVAIHVSSFAHQSNQLLNVGYQDLGGDPFVSSITSTDFYHEAVVIHVDGEAFIDFGQLV